MNNTSISLQPRVFFIHKENSKNSLPPSPSPGPALPSPNKQQEWVYLNFIVGLVKDIR